MHAARALAWLLALVLLAAAPRASGAPSRSQAPAEDLAVAAYRAGDYTSARTIWTSELEGAASRRERARLCYNLGNCAYREGELLTAVAWYTASRRLHPRGADLWHNLELARSEAGLEPADRGDLDATLARLLSSLTLAESEWLVLALAGLLAAMLAGEAMRGRAFRTPALAAAILLVLGSAPWIWNLLGDGGHPRMVVAENGAPARSEPGRVAETLAQLDPGTVVEQTDELPDWIEVRTRDGRELWVRSSALFDLQR